MAGRAFFSSAGVLRVRQIDEKFRIFFGHFDDTGADGQPNQNMYGLLIGRAADPIPDRCLSSCSA